MSYSSRLREELSGRALAWATDNGFPHECTIGNAPAVIFREGAHAVHGNFHPESYKCIYKRPEWRCAFKKPIARRAAAWSAMTLTGANSILQQAPTHF